MNRLALVQRAQILGLLVEGNSLRATSRLADVSINTVTKLLVDVGTACADYQSTTLRNLPCKRVQIDEFWAFFYAKERKASTEKEVAKDAGDIWTWTAICADTKLAVSWLVGERDPPAAISFVCDLSSRLANRIQLAGDRLPFYAEAVEAGLAEDVDYAVLHRHYGQGSEGYRKYSPPVVIGTKKVRCKGSPDKDHVSTSYVERQNPTMRMSMRRFTPLRNAFSKKVENHAHAVAVHFMYYNFGRIHKTLRITPAMAAGVTNHVWSLEEIVHLAE
jgi:hypothetical protein